MIRAYQIFNALSLDVAIGACISAAFVASYLGISVYWITLLALSISVWIIYTLDHLIDAKSIRHRPHTFRHYFHQQYFNAISTALAIAGLTELMLLWYLPFPTLLWGMGLLSVVVLYFLVLWLFRFKKVYHKEVLIAMVYTCGVFLPSLSISRFPLDKPFVLLFLQIFLVALSNLLIFSALETRSDTLDEQKSLATILGEVSVKQIIWILLIVGIAFAIVGMLTTDPKGAAAHGVLLLMNVLLSLILALPSWHKNDNYRFIGDGIFYIPLVYILLA